MNDNDLYFIYNNKVNMSFIPTPSVSGGDIREPFNYNDVKVLRLGRFKKQHFVPKFYLKNFTSQKGTIFCYSLQTRKFLHNKEG